MADLERFKLSNVIYDSDKNKDGFFAHVDTFGNIVRSCASGYYLEDMLDSKLHRSSIQQGSVPSFLLLDPDFAGPAPMIEATNPDDPEDEPEEAVEPAAVEDDNASVNATFASAAVGSATPNADPRFKPRFKPPTKNPWFKPRFKPQILNPGFKPPCFCSGT